MQVVFEIVEHKVLADFMLEAVAALKNQYWPFTIESQKEWINSRFLPNDKHILGYADEKLVAYASVTIQSCIADSEQLCFLGLGNVCVHNDCRGKGYGMETVRKANDAISYARLPGLLLCHKGMVGFYEKVGWHLVPATQACIDSKPFEDCIMRLDNGSNSIHNISFTTNF